MALDISAFTGLPAQAQTYQPRVIPRRRPTPSRTQFTGVNPFQTPFVPIEMPTPAMALPKPRPAMQGPQPAPQLVLPDELTIPQMNNTPAAPAQMAPQGGLLGNLLASDLNSAKGRGIMSAAASLLESGGPVVGAPAPTIGQALGRAYSAGMGAFDAQKAAEDAKASQAITDRYKTAQAAQMEAAAKRPIMTDYAGGAFTRVTDPITGETKIVENTDVTEFLKEQAVRKQTKNINLTDKQIESQTEDLDNITATNDLLADTDGFLDLIDGGMLEFGALDRMGDAIALSTGLGDTQEARNSAAFDRYISRLRNELLRMAKGVQTDGDAQRAIDEIVSATESRDTEAVKQALEDLRKVQQRTIKRYREKVQNRRKAKGLDEYDFGNEASADGVSYSVVEDDD